MISPLHRCSETWSTGARLFLCFEEETGVVKAWGRKKPIFSPTRNLPLHIEFVQHLLHVGNGLR
jgi:hypothetical protein